MSSRMPQSLWQPTRLVRVVESYDTSTGTTNIKSDATYGFLKVLGNRQGPHVLVAEWVASSLARWFGLTVPDFAVFPLPESECFDLPRGARAQPGSVFISRHMPGRTWGGSESELRTVENPTDITRLIVFDTWVRNCDRHPPDLSKRRPNYANVYIADTDRRSRTRLVAIDHTHCFDCGRDLTDRLAQIDKLKDERTYGLFPSFGPFVSQSELSWCMAMLRTLTPRHVADIIAGVPADWQLTAQAASALIEHVHGRAGFVADRIGAGWLPGSGSRENQPAEGSSER